MSLQTSSFGTMTLGSLPPWKTEAQVVSETLEHIRAAEAVGFASAWVAEHNARPYGIFSAAHLMLAAAAAQTTRIRLGTAVTRVPLHHPLHLAEELSIVDHISTGRLDWGIGKGYDDLEFASYGLDKDEREARFRLGESVVLRAWRDGKVREDSELARIPHPGLEADGQVQIELFPKPLQDPHPPVYVMISTSDDTVVWAAERGYRFVLGQWPRLDNARKKADIYAEAARNAGYSDEEILLRLNGSGQVKNVHVNTSGPAAIKEYENGLMWFMHQKHNRAMFGFSKETRDYEYYVNHDNVVLGDPQYVVDRLRGFTEHTGLGQVICWFDCGGQPHEQVMSAMHLFAEEVIPRVAA